MNNVWRCSQEKKKKKCFDLLIWIDSNANFKTGDLQRIELEGYVWKVKNLTEVTSEMLKLVN